MAIDSAAKRASVVGVLFAATILIPPDGTVAQADRQTAASMYGGIAAGAPVSNIDNICKRSSVVGFYAPWTVLVKPDGSFNQGERQAMAHQYCGILAGEAVEPEPGVGKYRGFIVNINRMGLR